MCLFTLLLTTKKTICTCLKLNKVVHAPPLWPDSQDFCDGVLGLFKAGQKALEEAITQLLHNDWIHCHLLPCTSTISTAQSEYPQGTVWIPIGHSLNTHRAQSEYPQGTVWIPTRHSLNTDSQSRIPTGHSLNGHSLNTHRAHFKYSQGTVWVHTGHSLTTHRAHFEYTQGTVWIPTGHSLNTHRAHFEYPQGTVWIPTEHSLNTHRGQSEYPQGTVWIPTGHSITALPWPVFSEW